MKMKQLIAGCAIAGGLSAAALGLGAGLAYADPPQPDRVPFSSSGRRFPGGIAMPTTALAGTTGRSNTKAIG